MDELENNEDQNTDLQTESNEPVFKFSLEDESSSNNTVKNEDDFEYRDLDEDLALEHLANSRGISVDEFKTLLDNRSNDQYVELDDNLAFQHIAESKGMTVDEFRDSLTPKEQKQYAPKMEAFDKFIRETGNENYNDFLESQKDWSTESSENTLREFIRLSNPDLSRKEQDFLYNEKYSTQDLDEEDDESLITRKGIELKTDLRKANAFFTERQEKFKEVGGSDLHIPLEYREAKQFIENQNKEQESYNNLLEEVRQDNISKANQTFSNNSEGFGYDVINDDKSVDRISYKPENMQQARAWHSDLKNLNDLFFDESSKIKNVKEFHAVSEIARIGVQKYTEQIVRTAQANLIEKQDRISKNIQIDNVSNPVNTQSGIRFFVE